MSLAIEKEEAIKVARELFYPKETIKAIRDAKTVYEINRALVNARKNG